MPHLQVFRSAITGIRCGSVRQDVPMSQPDFTHVGILAARGLLLVTPYDRTPGPNVENLDASTVVPADAPPTVVASALLERLAYQPRTLPLPNWGPPDAREAENGRSKTLLHVFGVKRVHDWLGEARHVAVTTTHGWLTFHPSRHARPDEEDLEYLDLDAMVSARVDDRPEVIVDGLREALDRSC